MGNIAVPDNETPRKRGRPVGVVETQPRNREYTSDKQSRRGRRYKDKYLEDRKSELRRVSIEPVDVPWSDDEIEAICRDGIPGYDPWKAASGFHFEVTLARKVITFFHHELSHVKGDKAWKGFGLEEWEVAIVGNLFGWVDGAGLRRYRNAFVYIPRKNGKTPLAAGIILYCLFEGREYGAEIIGAADDYKLASLVFDHASNMVVRNPNLFPDRAQLLRGQNKSIQLKEHPSNIDDLGTYKVITGSAKQHGYNMTVAVIDELHVMDTPDLIDTLESSISGRKEPLIVMITTADYNRESICNTKYEYAKRVRDRLVEDTRLLPVIYEADPDKWEDREEWKRCNPNLGVSKYMDYMQYEYAKCKNDPSTEGRFKRLELNIRTTNETTWIPLELWDACNATAQVKPRDTCYIGLDLARTRDTTARVAVFPRQDGTFDVLPHFWIPRDNAKERETRDKVPYSTWERLGFLTMTPGDVTDFGYVRSDLVRMVKEYDVRLIGYDKVYANELIQGLIRDDHLRADTFRIVPQTWACLAAPTQDLERLVRGKLLRHGGHPVLRWQMDCVRVIEDRNGNPWMHKGKSSGRIDGVFASVMALAVFNEGAPKRLGASAISFI